MTASTHTKPPALLDDPEVQRQLRISQRQLKRLRVDGKIGCVRLTPNTVRYTQAQVDAFIAACSAPAVGEA